MKFFAPLALLCLSACSTFTPPDQVQQELDAANAAAIGYLQDDKRPAAAQLLQAVLAIDPANERALELTHEYQSDEIENVFPRGYLGSNRAHRITADNSVWTRMLLYVPDRVLDLLDVVSFDAHVGWGLFANVHVTRAVQFGAGFRAATGLGWHDHRSFGLQTISEGELVIPGVGVQGIAGALAGTSGIYSMGDGEAGVLGPMAELYQVYRDYWAIGFQATAVVVGVDIDIHPVEIADWLAGHFPIDFLRDDLAETDTIWMKNADRNLLWSLSEIRRSAQSMDAFRAWMSP